MKGYWAVILIMIVIQISFFWAGVKPACALADSRDCGRLYLLSNGAVAAAIGSAELWLRVRSRYHKQVVTGCGFVLSCLLYFIVEPFADGAQMAWIVPIVVPLVYFDRRLLLITGGMTSVSYAGVYLLLERPVFDKPLLEFLLVEAMIALFIFIANGVIIRAYEASMELEQLTKSEQSLLVERAISDRLLKIDALTELYNHKTFHEYLDSLLEQCEKNGLKLQLGLLDIDNFKQINDTYGHWIGDIVLKEVAARLRETIGLNDFAARYGGEEFAVIFTDKTLEESREMVEKLREAVERMEHPYAGDKPITVSIGLCEYERGDAKEMLFRKTDDALYEAKRTGKNKVVLCTGAYASLSSK
ncbi:diguanylate cyclase [Paenibacillus spiritus]|uniref:Diguanylate cyclase n=2 Tax=Paenibacillus spiritus TaxID=2496557 RepID=A0A5J5GB58_9BACL|nr:diguanylate cyclase [Paenibacillus spiritus]